MTDAHGQPRAKPDIGEDPGRGAPGVPRWVKVSGIVVAILVLALVASILIGGGDHGPRRHAGGDHLTERIEQRPPGDEPAGGPDWSEGARG